MFKFSFFKNLVGFEDIKVIITIISLAALIAVFAVIRKKSVFNTKILTYGAISITAAFVLSFFRVIELPNGGSITIAAMLPIFIFAYIAGPTAGMVAGLCFGLLDFIREPFMVHPVQFILDYPLAFAVLGLAGIFKNNIYLGAVVGCFARLICHVLSGVVFFAEYANGQNVFVYSFLYNASYLVPDIIICLGILMVPNLRNAIRRIRTASFS